MNPSEKALEPGDSVYVRRRDGSVVKVTNSRDAPVAIGLGKHDHIVDG